MYIPDKVILKEIPKSNNKTRPIAIATVVDRCIQGCLNNTIYEVEDLYKDQLVAMLKEAKGEYGVLLACLSGLECKIDDKTKETIQQICT